MAASAPSRRAGRRQVRDLQRAAHLLAGLLLLAYVYLAPLLDGWPTQVMRWFVVPVAIASGLALWKWQRVRSRLARRGAAR